MLGSSPRVWGQATSAFFVVAIPRIIPTRVGTRKTSITTRRKRWDHPHACGDKISLRSAYGRSLGSSPRVWGQAPTPQAYPPALRIIPTRVGTSCLILGLIGGHEDHPHACGDKKDDQYLIVSAKGSSPRVWGQERQRMLIHVLMRIIPTRVGTRPRCLPLWSRMRDHPHACGDKRLLSFL